MKAAIGCWMILVFLISILCMCKFYLFAINVFLLLKLKEIEKKLMLEFCICCSLFPDKF